MSDKTTATAATGDRRVQVRLDRELHRRLSRIAKSEDRDLSSTIRTLVREALDRRTAA